MRGSVYARCSGERDMTAVVPARARRPARATSITVRLLVELDADVLDQLAVLFVVAANELRELRGRQDQGLEAARHVELLREVCARQDFLNLGAQRGHDRFRRARGSEQAEPDVDRISGIELADGRQVGEALGATLPAGRERT